MSACPRMRLPLVAALCAFASLVPVPAADLAVRAFLDPAQGINDATPFRLIIVIEGADSPQVAAPRLPALRNLSVVSGPNSKTNISWINGRTTSTHEVSYSLLPTAPGDAEIPPIEVRIGSQVYRTEPFRIQVARAPAGRGGAPGSGPGGADATADASALFLEATLGTTEAWVGQPVALTVTLFTQPRVSGFVWRKQPDFAKFWVEPVDFDTDADAYRTRVDGRAYTAYPVERKVLIAPGPGRYDLEPYLGQVQVHVNRDDPFDWFRFGRSETVLRKSQPLTLTVRPLPAAGKPEEFGGAVGSYAMSAALDRGEARVDDAVALQATVEGEGVLLSVGAPALEAPSDVKVFDPKVKESVVRTRGGKVFSRKTWEWILVPLKPGDIRVPELRFDFFDPASESYKSASSDPLLLGVRRAEPGEEGPPSRGAMVARRDLAFIKPLRGTLRAESPRAHERVLFQALLALPLVLVPLWIVTGRRYARQMRDQGFVRGRRAQNRARKRIAAARRRMAQADPIAFHEEVARTLVDYLADRTNRSAAGLTYETAEELLAERGVDGELRRAFRACLETCDFVRFVPGGAGVDRRTELLVEAERLIEALERAW